MRPGLRPQGNCAYQPISQNRENTPTKVLIKCEMGNVRITEYLQLEKVLANWPDLLSTFRVEGSPATKFTQEEFTYLRNSNINIMLTLSDGHGYLGRGLGVTTAGTSADAVMQANRMMHDLKAVERWCNEQLQPLSDQYTFKLSLIRIGDGIYISDPQMGVFHQAFSFPSLKSKFK